MLIQDLKIILKVAELKSITAAATSLDMQTATASAAVKRVEKTLGTELFIRTTRHLRLSPAGEKFLPNCEKALLMLDQAKLDMKDDMATLDGELRLSLSSDLGRNIVIPWIDAFMHHHPDITLNVTMSDSNIDFYRDSVDIALRYGSPKEANIYGFKICDVPTLLCASPDYLDRHGTPTHPDQLAQHNGLFYKLYDLIYNEWRFEQNGSAFKVKMKGDRIANDGDLVRRWCNAGKGIALKSCLDMSNDLLAGNVINLMPDYKPRTIELWLICPSRQSITPAVRLLRDTLRDNCKELLQRLVDQNILDKKLL